MFLVLFVENLKHVWGMFNGVGGGHMWDIIRAAIS